MFFCLVICLVQGVWAESVNLRLNISFKTNDVEFGEKGEKVLDRLYEVSQALVETQILISGHTDSTGPEEYNQTLSLKRAESVAAYLKIKGVDPSRTTTKGFGEAAPITSNATAEGRQKNRRVVASILGLTKEELNQVMIFLRRESTSQHAGLEPGLDQGADLVSIEEAASVEELKKGLEVNLPVRKPRRVVRDRKYYITGFSGPHWSSAFYGGDLAVEHGKFTAFSLGVDAGMRLSKRWFVDGYFYYLPTEVSEGVSGIDFEGVPSDGALTYENNIYGLRLGRIVKASKTYRFSVIGGISSHIIGGIEPRGGGDFNFKKFQHIGVTVGIRHEQKITKKWVFDSDLAYLFPVSVDKVADFSGTIWYRGILGVKRKLTHRLRLGVEYQVVYHESNFSYEGGASSKPEFLIQTLMAGLKYNF